MLKKILIAEDDAFLIKFLANKLKEEGFEVDSVANGNEALAKLEKGKYNLIMTDLIMPELDGFGLLKELNERGDTTPVLVFSSLSQSSDEEEVMRLGAKALIDKTNFSDSIIGFIEKYIK